MTVSSEQGAERSGQQEQGNRMSNKVFLLALSTMLSALCSSAVAQQPKNVNRIGYLYQGDRITGSVRSEAIRLALRELGYVEGQNIAIEYRYAEGNVDRVPELAADLVRLKVDIIVIAGGNPIIRAARNGPSRFRSL